MKRLRHPIRAIREPFGTAGLLVACIALVAALGGTAFAAAKLNSTQKKEVEKIAKKFAGKPGPAGANGTNGTVGANGKDGGQGEKGAQGTPGVAGTNGTNGKTVLSGAANPTNATGTQGDFYINTTTSEIFGPKPSNAGAWGSGTSLKGANGTPGLPWVVGTAPAGVVMKGTWSVPYYDAAGAGELVTAAASTGVPVNPITGFALGVKQGENLPGQSTEEREEAEGFCPGSAEDPQPSTAPGTISLCVYVAQDTNLKPPFSELTGSGGGAAIQFETNASGPAKAYGSWVLVTQ